MKIRLKSYRFTILNSVIAIIYIALFRLVYVNYLAVWHAQYAYRVENENPLAIASTNLLAFLPILLYKAEDKISDLISIFLYVMVYVPTLIGLQYYYEDYTFVLPFQFAYLFAFVLFFLSGRNKISKQKYGNLKNSINSKYFIAFAVFDILLIIILFHSKMRFVSFYNVYDLREENAEISSGIPLVPYLILWLNSICPLIIAIGCKMKNKWYILLGFFMTLIYYMIDGMKSILFISAVAYGIFYLLNKKGMKYVFPIIVLPLVLSYLLIALDDDEVVHMGISIMMNRTYGISSQITPMYIDVFENHPHTYLAHVRIINSLTGLYPFGDQALGYAISELYSGKYGQSNSNFLVTDGIASAGVVGIILISLFFYFLISFLNKVTNRFGFGFVAATMIGAILELSNLSIFTTLLSSGLLFLIFYYRFVKL